MRRLQERSPEELLPRFLAKVAYEPNTGCWLWTAAESKEYGSFWNGRRTVLSHRWSYEYFVDEPGDMCVCHHCDTPLCVNPGHLFLGTVADNNHDTKRKRRSTFGVRNPSAKLSRAEVEEIILRAHAGEVHGRIAEDYGVGGTAVRNIANRRTWKHVPRPQSTDTNEEAA